MNRQNYQQIGFIIALVIAGVSLPTSIIALTREPTIINDYFNDTYNYYNQTIYGYNETEPDYTKPLETTEHYNLNQYECILRNFTLDSNHVYWFSWNASTSFLLRFWVVRNIFYENVLGVNGTSQIHGYLSGIKLFERATNSDFISFHYIPPFHSDWLFIWQTDDIVTFNITLTDEILKI